ncbi:MAG TPA: D-TA family PLP-dependent enzyme [Bacteroidota bacterium]|nr:D-TA family PLP-dependent enzyme [Bacteroidota bacterium]
MNTNDRQWYEIANAGELDTPALAVYTERVRENIRALKAMVKDPSLLRPHAKTHKSGNASRMLIDEGITKFKCATIAEAEMLARAGAPDVLIAYQPVGPKVERISELTRKYPGTKFSTVIDHPEAAQAISAVFSDRGLTLPVLIDLNVGMNRTGIGVSDAPALFSACTDLEGILVAGLHMYDGHIQDADLGVRRARFDEAFKPVLELRKKLQEQTARALTLIAGGSPTFPFLAERGDVECSPGTFIYWDKSYQTLLADQPFKPSLLVLTRVISHPAPGLLCLDVGYKSVACEKDLEHRLFFIGAPDARIVSQSEEHVVIAAQNAERFPLGELFYAMPYHICPTCAMYERAAAIANHRAEGEWTMNARDKKITI